MLQPGENIGPAWGLGRETVMIRCSSELPTTPAFSQDQAVSEITVRNDCSLMDPLPERTVKPRRPGNPFALAVGNLVHKGMELWRFPEKNRSDPVLKDAFRKMLMLSDNLDTGEQEAAIEKAEMLLSRFRKSEAFSLIESAEERWHEIPFSFTKWNFTVNGVIDLLLKDREGYKIIDFKTDDLKDGNAFNKAFKEHSKQLENYRRALKTTLGEDPQCEICFLDYCGKVILQPVGKDPAGLQNEVEEPAEWPTEEPEEDNYMFEEKQTFSEKFLQEI